MPKKSGKNSKCPNAKPTVIIYTTPLCPWCKKTKEFFSENHIRYNEMDVASNEKARNLMFDKSGQMGVPVIDISGKIIVGYDVAAIKKALSMK